MTLWPDQLAGTVNVRRYHEKAEYCMTPEIADSIGYGTKIWPDKICPAGTGSFVAPD